MHQKRNTALALIAIALGMLMLAYASVPLYRLFCQATGFGGTPKRVEAATGDILPQQVTVDFNTDLAPGLPMTFHAVESSVNVHIGENRLVHFKAKNTSSKPLIAMASFNVVPDTMGSYFNKTQCFCFEKLTLKPGEEADLPVAFFIDPAVAQNPYLKNIARMTLSYTFYAVQAKPEK